MEEKSEGSIIGLHDTPAKVKTLSGILSICSSCKKILDDDGLWKAIETYISDHADIDFTHSICPDCKYKLYPFLKKNV